MPAGEHYANVLHGDVAMSHIYCNGI